MTEVRSWRHWAKRLETGVVAELRADPALWKEHKRLSKRDPGLIFAGAAGVAFVLLIYCGGILSEQTRAYQFNLVLWMLMSTASMLIKATTMRGKIKIERARLEYLPATDVFLFDYALAGARWGTIYLGVFYAFLACVGLIALGTHDALSLESALVLLLFVPLQAMSVYVMSLVVLAWVPERVTQVVSLTLMLLCVAIFFMAIWARGPLDAGLDWLAVHPRALLALPPAWSTYGILAFLDGHPLELLWTVPLLGLLALTPRLTRSLRARSWAETPKPEEDEGQEEEISEEEVVASIRDGVWLTRSGPEPHGWLDRAVLVALSPRQQWIYRFLQPEPAWTQRWMWGVGLLGAAPVLSLVFPLHELVLVILICIGCMLGLPSFGQEWSGLILIKSEGGWSPRYAHYPLTYPEIVQVLLRVNGVRAVAFIVPAFALGTLLGVALNGGLLDSAALPMRAAVVYAGLFPALVVANFISMMGTHKVRCFPLVIGVVWVSIALTGLIMLLMHPGSAVRSSSSGLEFVFRPYAVAGGSILFALGWGSYFLYPYIYRRTDLVRAIPPEMAVAIEAQREAERQKTHKK